MEVTLGASEGILGLLSNVLLVASTSRGLMVVAISVLTFQFLDVFMSGALKLPETKEKKSSLFVTSLAMLLVVITPIVVIIVRLIHGDFRLHDLTILFILSMVGGLIIGLILKFKAGEKAKGQTNMLMFAGKTLLEELGQNLAYWIQRMLFGIVNVFLNVLRAPFIIYYMVVANGLNLMLSLLLTSVMGSSSGAGEVNIIGSVIGGIAHAIIRRKRLKELKEKFATAPQ